MQIEKVFPTFFSPKSENDNDIQMRDSIIPFGLFIPKY